MSGSFHIPVGDSTEDLDVWTTQLPVTMQMIIRRMPRILAKVSMPRQINLGRTVAVALRLRQKTYESIGFISGNEKRVDLMPVHAQKYGLAIVYDRQIWVPPISRTSQCRLSRLVTSNCLRTLGMLRRSSRIQASLALGGSSRQRGACGDHQVAGCRLVSRSFVRATKCVGSESRVPTCQGRPYG